MLDSRFQSPGFRIPQAKNSWIQESGFPYMGRQQQSNLPRSYLIEACQQSLDDEWNITKTPGMCPGAELPFKDLLEKELRKQVSKSYN